MNLKSKIFGFAAASVFALTMTTGAMAAQPLEATSTVNLAAGTCALVDVASTTASFGEWKWNGEGEYKPVDPGNSNVAGMTARVKNHKPDGTCNIAVSSNGLGSGAIAPSNITVSTNNPTYTDIQLSSGFQTGSGFQAGPMSASFTLNDVPDNLQPGTYSGKINFQVTNGS